LPTLYAWRRIACKNKNAFSFNYFLGHIRSSCVLHPHKADGVRAERAPGEKA